MSKSLDYPLPSHTVLRYDECYAKVILEYLFPPFHNSLILSDKPDLHDKSNKIGIEVTNAESSKSIEAEKLYCKLPYVKESTRKRYIERITQCGSIYKDGILFEHGVDTFDLINESIRIKTTKIRTSQYNQFDNYHLFIFSSIYIDESMLKKSLLIWKKTKSLCIIR